MKHLIDNELFNSAFFEELSPEQIEQIQQAKEEISQGESSAARALEEENQAPTKSKPWETPEKDFQNRLSNAGARDFEIAMLEDQASNRLETHLNLQAKAKYQSYEESNNIGGGWASSEQIAENVKAQQEYSGIEKGESFKDELTTESLKTLERHEEEQARQPMEITTGSEISQSQGEGQRLKAE